MPTGPAARVGDPVAHPAPPVLGPGPGSTNVLIGNKPAWRGVGGAAAAAIQAAIRRCDYGRRKRRQSRSGNPRCPGRQGRGGGRQGRRRGCHGLHDCWRRGRR